MTDLYNKYLEYKNNNPEERLSYSKWKLQDKLDKRRDSYRESYQKLTNKKLYYQHKNEEYKKEIKELKSSHKRELSRIKRERKRPVQWVRKVKSVKQCNCGSKEIKEKLNKPLDKKGRKAVDLTKLLIGLNECSAEDRMSSQSLTILSLASIAEYLDAETLLKWLNIRRTTMFNVLQSLTNQGYLSVAQVKSINKKKSKNRYFITLFGSEYLQSFINRVGRRTYNIIK